MKKCLNCGAELLGPYCHACGQNSQTHRYALKTLFTHDLLHSLWHVDKSILRSWWRVLKSPGREAKKNIAGSRAGQFPIFTLSIFATVLILFAFNFRSPPNDITRLHIGNEDYSDWMRHNAKWLWLAMILFFSLSSAIYFRKSRYNLAEHIVLMTYVYVGTVTATALFTFLIRMMPNHWEWSYQLSLGGFFIYIGYAYWKSFKIHYSFAGWSWRFAMSFITSWIFVLLTTLALSIGFHRKIDLHFGTETDAGAGHRHAKTELHRP